MRPISLLLTDLALIVIPAVLICGQSRRGDYSQGNLGKVIQANRASRSHSLTGGNLGVRNLKNVISVDWWTSLQEAINSASSGGTVFIPPDFSVTLSSSLNVSKDIHIIGVVADSSLDVIASPMNGQRPSATGERESPKSVLPD